MMPAMDVRVREQSPRNERGGQTSWLLLDGGRMTVTWVEGAPGSRQPLHAHAGSEQVYVIVRGRGTMIVDEERRVVAEGALVRIPPGATHAIENGFDEPLAYVSATVPPFAAVVEGGAWRPA
jgi:mannose-6-phosphate isomerase-like protein (cupin superfamily)